MSVKVDILENSMAKLTIEVPAEDLEKALQNAYNKQKKNISVPGFRKGKVPRTMVEKMYGPSIFYEDAANELIPMYYTKAANECELDIVSRPSIEVEQLEKGKPFIFTAEVATKPEVTLGQYKGVEVLKADLTVTDEDIAAELKKEQEKNSRVITVEDRAAELGDVVRLDFEGTIDGEPFDGNQAGDYPLTLGSGSFIPGFEEQLVGVNVGEPVDVKVTFPEDYISQDLAGKDAVFACKINRIENKELPELDDDFAQDVSEFDTLEEYKADLAKQIAERKAAEAKTAKENAAVDQAVANAELNVPAAMIETEVDQQMDNLNMNIQNSGLTLEQYLQYTGQTMDSVREQMRPGVENNIKVRLVLEKIAEVEEILASDETIEEEMKNMAASYNMELDKVKEIMGAEENLAQMKKDLAGKDVIKFIAENAVEVDSLSE